MTVTQEYAGELRVGESGRDASDKIRGFLFQDLLAINLILNSNDEDKIYVEWIEDIFVENTKSISIYQVKHYPESELNLQGIYENMFYQFLKFKLYEVDEKKIKTFCLSHAKSYVNFDKDLAQKLIKKENIVDSLNKRDIKNRLIQCKNMDNRKELVFGEVACTNLVDEFCFEKIESLNIDETRIKLRDTLYDRVDASQLSIVDVDSAKDILLAVAIQYIQISYYYKLEDYKLRVMTKDSFLGFMNRIIGPGEQAHCERIKFIVLGYVDEVFTMFQDEIENDEIVDIYKEIYFSTKSFFIERLKTKEQRFKFINTISTDEYAVLNKDKYFLGGQEVDKFLEHKDKIKHFIKIVWKILYNLDSRDFSNYIVENEECFLFEFPNEKTKPAIVISPGNGDSSREVRKVLPRIAKMKMKPRKWYFKGDIKGVYEYLYEINKIKVKDIRVPGDFSILYHRDNYFRIECMDCLKFDEGKLETKDDNNIFNFKCIKED